MCFDTCHAHAAGEEFITAVERVIAITGKIDLMHCNDSKDGAGTGATATSAWARGEIDPDALRGMIRAAANAGASVIVETPRDPDGLKADLEYVRQSIGS